MVFAMYELFQVFWKILSSASLVGIKGIIFRGNALPTRNSACLKCCMINFILHVYVHQLNHVIKPTKFINLTCNT